MPGSCLCTRRGPIGRFNPNKARDEQATRWFCGSAHEGLFAVMPEEYLQKFEINAIIGALPEIGKALADRGLVDKPFSQLTKDEICAIVADVVRSYRNSLDREADLAREIPF